MTLQILERRTCIPGQQTMKLYVVLFLSICYMSLADNVLKAHEIAVFLAMFHDCITPLTAVLGLWWLRTYQGRFGRAYERI